MRKVAVIPVKHKSERVENKNFKHFYKGTSLFELKLDQLVKSNCFDHIYVSTNSPFVNKILDYKNHNNVSIISRSDSFCNNEIPWSEVIHHIADSLPEEDETCVAWCHTTSPLFNSYKECVELFIENFNSNRYNGLVTVSNFNDFLVDEKSNPINYAWGPWHKYSQYLTKYYTINGALFIATKKEIVKNRYVISTNPYLHCISKEQSIDVDDDLDFEFAQFLYSKKNVKK